jgi:SMODS-associating 2TM, beta-strand rich effector domain
MNMLADKQKYFGSVLFVFVLGAVLQVAISQLIDNRTSIHNFRDLASSTYDLTKTLKVDLTGIVKIWQFVASGGFLAGIYCWLFERWLWKCPWLQGWLVRFPNMQGTWVGVIIPETKAMQASSSQGSSAKKTWWEQEKVVPVHVTILHQFDRLTFTAKHPNSENTTRTAQLEYREISDETALYVVYHNVPDDSNAANAAAHDGCNELKFRNDGRSKSATIKWELKGKYWTDKPRDKNNLSDRGTWGRFVVHWESRRSDEEKPNWTHDDRFLAAK